MTRSTVHTGKTKVWRHGRMQLGTRAIPEETPIALSYNGSTQAVMMATPADLEDFAVGFSLSEGVIERPAQIESFEIVPHDDGVELRMWLGGDVAERLAQRRRAIAGPTGCGLCGVDSIAEAVRPVATVGT
ncbi:MAG: formate dehydrogenase accessory sulfurtransferase FdhD, partial [Pseudomonadota bacterium]